MNGYVEGGYLVTIGAVSSYALALLRRERNVRRRLEVSARPVADEEQAAPPATSEPL